MTTTAPPHPSAPERSLWTVVATLPIFAWELALGVCLTFMGTARSRSSRTSDTDKDDPS